MNKIKKKSNASKNTWTAKSNATKNVWTAKSNAKIERNQECLDCKRKLDDIFDQKVESIKIRSKCKRYEEGEKNSKFYFNLGKLW